MKNRLLATLLVAALVGLLTMLACSRPEPAVNAQPVAKGQKWEYKIMDIKARETEFNKLGADGWEYSGQDINKGLFIFKRPKR
jgi:hypothetical protein